MSELLNSIRMRARSGEKHISGAERLISAAELETVAQEMLQRALRHPRGVPEKIVFQVENIEKSRVIRGKLPDLCNNRVVDWQAGRQLAAKLLRDCGVSPQAIDRAFEELQRGPGPGGQSMRGAMLVAATSGERLEDDPARGVRVSRMDLSTAALGQLQELLEQHGLNNLHVIEALTLAAKVIAAPAVLAELCWSDDPEYTAGYVASAQYGYQRISQLKPAGDDRGGRAFFVTGGRDCLAGLIAWLEKQPYLVDQIGQIQPPRDWRD